MGKAMLYHETHYILDDNNNPIPAKDVLEWARFYETNRRILKQDQVGHYFISTVFLGIDHNFGMQGAAILFESMVFDQLNAFDDLEQKRYETFNEAMLGHKSLVEEYEAK